VDAVHEQLAEILGPARPDWTEELTRRAISGYGRYRELTKGEVAEEVRRIQGELQQVEKIRALENAIWQGKKWLAEGYSPEEVGKMLVDQKLLGEKTGIERRVVGFNESLLIKKVNELKKAIPVPVSSGGQGLRTALDAAKTAARNRLRELDLEISRRQRIVKEKKNLVPDAELTELRRLIAERKAVHELVFPRAPLTDAQRAERGAKALDRIADQLEKDMASGKLWPDARKPAPSSPAYEAAKARVEALRAQRDELRDQKDPNRAYRANLLKRLADLRERVANEDFAPKPLRKERKLSKAELDVLYQIELEKNKFSEGQEAWKRQNRTKLGKVLGGLSDANSLFRAVTMGGELSFVLRQGKYLTFESIWNPQRFVRNLAKGFASWSDRGNFKINEEIRRRENAPRYHEFGLNLSSERGPWSAQEETLWGHWTEKIPVLRNMEHVGRNFLNLMRVDALDALIDAYSVDGTTMSPTAGKLLAEMVNVCSGRGSLGRADIVMRGAAEAFTAPRFVVSRFQYLLGTPLWNAMRKGDKRATKLIAQVYAKQIAGGMVYYGLMAMLYGLLGDDDDPDLSIELSPLSSDFLKLRYGRTRIDPFAGVQQVAVALARTWYGQTKTTSTGKIIDLRGPNRSPVSESLQEKHFAFVRQKLTPLASATADWIYQDSPIDRTEVPTLWSTAVKLSHPITYDDMWEVLQDQGLVRGSVMAGNAYFGEGVQVHSDRKPKTKQSRRSVRRRAR
jgi:hypothetical protein